MCLGIHRSYKFIQSFQAGVVRLAQHDPKQQISYYLKKELRNEIDFFFSACRLGIQLYIYLIPDIHMSVVRHTWAYQMLFRIFDCSVKIELSYVADFGKWVDIHRSYKLIQSFLVISFNESDFFLSSSPIILSVNQIS